MCGVLGDLAPVHRCARSVRCFAFVVSWATWLLFTGVPARCVALCVRCSGPLGSCSPVCSLGLLFCSCPVLGHLAPVHRCARFVRRLCVQCTGPLGSSSPVCPPGALFCLCGVLGHLAPVHQFARSVSCSACAVSWATWLLFTGGPALCVVLRVRCPGPLGSCSPVRSPGVLCGVLGHLAPVHRCARSVCCAVCCVCRILLGGAHLSIRTAAVRSRQALGTPQAHTRPSGRRLFCSRQGLGSLPGGHTSVRMTAVAAWHLSVCLGRGRRRASLACLVAQRGAPRLVQSGRSRCSGRLSRRHGAFLHPGRLRARLYWVAAPGSLCLPLAPAEAGALGSLRVVPVWGPAMGLSLGGPSGVSLRLRALR